MVSHTPFQSYRTNICMQCMTGTLGCRWHRYQQSRRTNRKRDIFWFTVFCVTFFYVVYFFYFWLIAVNNFDGFNWYIYNHIDVWHPWYSIVVGVVCALFIYYFTLMLLSLCHIIHSHQLYIYPVHIAFIVLTLAFCIATTVIINDVWHTQWAIVTLSLQMTGPFLYIGAVSMATLLSWVVASRWMHLRSLGGRLLCFVVYACVMACLYSLPAFINSPCVINIEDLPHKPKVIAHRGASGLAPENTLISFQYAIDNKAFGIETDVHISKDGIAFLLHDYNLRRTTNITVEFPDRVNDKANLFTFDELQRLDAGSWYLQTNPMGSRITDEDKRKYKGQRIPTFRQLLKLARKYNKVVLFDLNYPSKSHPFRNATREIVLDDIAASNIEHHLIWWLVYNIEDVAKVRARFNFTFVYGKRGSIDDLESVNVSKVNVEAEAGSEAWIKKYEEVNITTNEYLINTKWLYSLFWCMGADSIITDSCHRFNDMDAPSWTMRPSTFIIVWITVNCTSSFVVAVIFIIQRLRLVDENPEAVSLQNSSRANQNYSETTFQSPGAMKLKLLPSVDSLDSESPTIGISNGHMSMPVDVQDNISFETLYGQHMNGRPPITDFGLSNQSKA